MKEPLRRKDWPAVQSYFDVDAVTIKGRERPFDAVRIFVLRQTGPLRDLELIVEEVLQRRIARRRAAFELRVALVGTRVTDGARDGIIADTRVVFAPDETGAWKVRRLSVRCPPDWAKWNSRPNPRAPVHYGRPRHADAGRQCGD